MYEEDSPAKEAGGSRLPLSQQEKALAELHETISVLTDRLGSVLTPVSNDAMKEAGDRATPSQSPLAEQLDANNMGIRKASTKLSALMERIEC